MMISYVMKIPLGVKVLSVVLFQEVTRSLKALMVSDPLWILPDQVAVLLCPLGSQMENRE